MKLEIFVFDLVLLVLGATAHNMELVRSGWCCSWYVELVHGVAIRGVFGFSSEFKDLGLLFIWIAASYDLFPSCWRGLKLQTADLHVGDGSNTVRGWISAYCRDWLCLSSLWLRRRRLGTRVAALGVVAGCGMLRLISWLVVELLNCGTSLLCRV